MPSGLPVDITIILSSSHYFILGCLHNIKSKFMIFNLHLCVALSLLRKWAHGWVPASTAARHDAKLWASKPDNSDAISIGYVRRLAARKYDGENSQPSSRLYTTRKDEHKEGIWVGRAGVRGDYNHYRSLALKGTPDRAVSLLTTDTMNLLRSCQYPVVDGDLGENILLDGLYFSFFEPGRQYRLKCKDDEVVLEIIEPVTPCANLCKLLFIINETKTPKERIKDCQDFISLLDSKPGLRGWYAKVIQEGGVFYESVLTQV